MVPLRNPSIYTSAPKGLEAKCTEFLVPLKPGQGVQRAYEIIRQKIPRLEEDRETYRDINALVELVRTGSIVHGVEEIVGPLN